MALAIEALEGRQFLSEAVGPGPEVVALFQARRSGDPPQVGGDGRIRKAPHFYELYTGPRRPGLNVVEARGLFRNGRRFLLTGTMQGRIDRREPALYVFGINRGGARAGPFPNRPDIRFDAVVVVSVGPSGVGGSVSDLATGTTTDLPTQAVRVAGRRMRAVVDADLLPSTGLPPRCYRFNLWPRTGPGGPEKIASFAPESTTLRVGLPRPHRRSHPCPPVAAPPTPPPPVEPPTPPPVEPPTQPPVEPPIQPPSVPAPQVIAQAITVTNLREPDGTPTNQSRVVVPFTQEINVADASRLTLAGTAINPVAPSPPVTVAIPILSAAKDPADPRNLVLTTGVLVPQGASLTIGAGALTGAAGQVMEGQSVAVPQGVGIVDFTMANRAFKPTDINLFGGDAFTTASFAPNAPGTGADEATTRSQLDAFLGRKVSLGLITDAQRADALARYDSAATKAIIPDPSLRAGLFSLLGTVAGGAVEAVLTGNNQTGRPFSSVDYDPTVTGVGVALTDAPPGEPVRIRFNPRYRGESFQALGAIIVHEVGHQDSRPVNGVNLANSRNEEVLLDSARAIAWAQSLLVDPSLAAQNTFLVRSNNTVLLALLNSGNIASPSVGLGEAPQVLTGATAPTPRVFVGGSEFYRSFDNYIRTQAAFGGIPEADTSGNLYLDSLLSAIIGSPVTGRDFSLATIAFVDQDQRALSNEQAVTLAGILRLTLPAAPPIAPSVFTQGIAVANEREPDGTPANRSRLVVPFTQAVNLVDAGRLTLTGTAIDPANPSATRSVSIPILSAVRDTSDPRNLVLTTGVLVPRGTQLAIGAGAVTGASTSLPSATQTVTIPQGVGQVDANRAFRPTDVNLFGRDAFTTASFAPDAPGTGADEATTRSLLDAFLGRKVSLGLITDAQRADALARYDSAATKAIIETSRRTPP